MPDFAWPWALLALPLPWLAMRLLPVAPQRLQAALRVPYAHAFKSMRIVDTNVRRARLRRWLPLLGWMLLCVAAARPQQLGDGRARALEPRGREEPDEVPGDEGEHRLEARLVERDRLPQHEGDRGQQQHPRRVGSRGLIPQVFE